MSTVPRVLAFAGSTRTASYNKMLAKIAAEGARKAGAEVTYIDLRDFPMPLYDGDLQKEIGFPETVKGLRQIFLEHQGLLIASPEYNGSYTGVLKNTIDWLSRADGDLPVLAAFQDKVAALMSASTGALGGIRGLNHLRAMLSSINILVLPGQRAVPKAAEVFDLEGGMTDPKLREGVEQLGGRLVDVLAKLYGAPPVVRP
jgi:chromate reductase, NAD(P)H dehydrogenase (quinone)